MTFPTCPLFGGSTVFPWKLSVTSFTGSSTYVATFPTFSFWRLRWVESVESFSRILSRMLAQSIITFIAFAARHSCSPGPSPSCAVGRGGENVECRTPFSHVTGVSFEEFSDFGESGLSQQTCLTLSTPTKESLQSGLLASESAHLPLSPLLSTLLKPNMAGFCCPLSLLSPASLCVN